MNLESCEKEMKETKYSVLLSVYKNEKPEHLRLAIESMLNQTIIPNQFVIVKDGSLTKVLDEIIDNFKCNNYELFTIVSLKENIGLGLALNEGIKHCKNEFIARMDADDISLEKRCELQLKCFNENDKLDIVGTNINEFMNNPNEIISHRIVPSKYEDIISFSKRRNPFNHPTVMYRKSAVLSCGGYGNYRRNQDFDLFVRMLNNGCVAQNINKSLLLFRADEKNLKRRKSWEKSKLDIILLYSFWREGYSSFLDFMIVSIAQLIVFILPSWSFNILSKKILRKSK